MYHAHVQSMVNTINTELNCGLFEDASILHYKYLAQSMRYLRIRHSSIINISRGQSVRYLRMCSMSSFKSFTSKTSASSGCFWSIFINDDMGSKRVSCIMYHVSCIMYHVSCMQHITCSMYHAHVSRIMWHFMSFDIYLSFKAL